MWLTLLPKSVIIDIMKNHKLKFKNTQQCFDKIFELLNKTKSKEGGLLFQNFTTEWHLANNDYIKIYNNPTIDTVPYHLLEKINAVELLKKGGDAFGIDKICIARSGEIDVHQDKSTVHINKKLSTNKATAMMSLRLNPLTNIRHYVINTTAQDISHYNEIYETQKPIIFSHKNFILDDDENFVELDLLFWKNVAKKNKGQKIIPLYNFVPRGQRQIDYVKISEPYVDEHMKNNCLVKFYQKAVGGMGKSVLDSVLVANYQLKYWNPTRTSTSIPINIDFYHGSKTLSANGLENIRRRRALGINDRVCVLSGTKIIDNENSIESIDKSFQQHNNAVSLFREIEIAKKLNQSVLIITLYHHSSVVQELLNLLRKKWNKNVKFWSRKRDECDWPCSNKDSSFAPALDDRTASVFTFGSTGTDRFGNASKDYGTNNIKIHGPCLFDYAWPKAEDEGLVKPMILLTPMIRMSELASLFPQLKNEKEKLNLNYKIKGISVNNEHPKAILFAKLACIIKSLYDYPEIKRILSFGSFIKTNKLAQQNWKLIAKKIIPQDPHGKKITNIHYEVLNDEQYNSNAVKHKIGINRAKSKTNYIIGSCRLFSRGYDDKSKDKKHHAGFHLDDKGIVETIQGIWRYVRIDENSDPYAYTILPLIYDDLQDIPTWSQSTLDTLRNIFKYNHRIKEEFESLLQSESESGRTTRNKKLWLLKDFDSALLKNLINTVATTSRGQIFEGLRLEAHNWLTNELLALPNPNHTTSVGAVKAKFATQEKFKILFLGTKLEKIVKEGTLNSKGHLNGCTSYVDFFFSGRAAPQGIKDKINENVLAWEEYKDSRKTNIKDKSEEFIKKCHAWWDSRPQYDTKINPTAGSTTKEFTKYRTDLWKKMNIPLHPQNVSLTTGKIAEQWFQNRIKKVQNLINLILKDAIDNYYLTITVQNPFITKYSKKYGRYFVETILHHPNKPNSQKEVKFKKTNLQNFADKDILKQYLQKVDTLLESLSKEIILNREYTLKHYNPKVRGFQRKIASFQKINNLPVNHERIKFLKHIFLKYKIKKQDYKKIHVHTFSDLIDYAYNKFSTQQIKNLTKIARLSRNPK